MLGGAGHRTGSVRAPDPRFGAPEVDQHVQARRPALHHQGTWKGGRKPVLPPAGHLGWRGYSWSQALVETLNQPWAAST